MTSVKYLLSAFALFLSASVPFIPSEAISHLPAKSCFHNCQIDDDGLSLLKRFEGYSPFPYPDVIGVSTIGFGHAIKRGERIRAPLLGPDAQTLLESDANAKAGAVNRMVEVPLHPGQANALISFTFNLGEGSLERSTLLKRVNSGRHAAVPAEFLKWDKAGGKVVRGLQIRRRAEADLYASDGL